MKTAENIYTNWAVTNGILATLLTVRYFYIFLLPVTWLNNILSDIFLYPKWIKYISPVFVLYML